MTSGALSIDRYRIERMLGQGGMGKVYLATDPKLNREVAIKVLAPNVVDERTRERFQLEARAIAALKHPNIVELYDYSGAGAAELFLVLEYIAGRSLYEVLSERGVLTERVALCVAHELSLALEHAYRFKVVHRDIKPENIMLHRGRVVVMDFGVAKVLEASEALGVDEVATHTQSIGTPGFMAPEQFVGRRIDHRVDIFAVGAVLYNLTTGQLPFEGRLPKGRSGPPQGQFIDPRTHNAELSAELCALLAKCLAPRAKDRFQEPRELRAAVLENLTRVGVTEVRQELERYEEGAPPMSAPRPVVIGPFTRATAVERAALGPVALVTLGAALGFVLCLLLDALGLIPLEWTLWFEGLAARLGGP